MKIPNYQQLASRQKNHYNDFCQYFAFMGWEQGWKNLGFLEKVFRFLPRDASAERGDEIACRPSVCPSVCL